MTAKPPIGDRYAPPFKGMAPRKSWRTSAERAAVIGTSSASILCWLIECWIDGHWSKSLIAAGAAALLAKELCVMAFSDGKTTESAAKVIEQAEPGITQEELAARVREQ